MVEAKPADPMPIKAIAPWYGSKRGLAPEIVRQLGPHRVYWEPFCGSLSVLLAKEPVGAETVNDLNGCLINLARVLRDEDMAVELYGRVNRLLFHEELFREAAESWRRRGRQMANDDPDVDRAFEYLICSWFGRNGVAGTESYNQGFCVRWTANGGTSATRWRNVVSSIPAWHQRLAGVTCLNRDAFELLEKVEDVRGLAMYIDPPYVAKGARYVHDFDAGDHERLAHALRRFTKARIVVSYYEHPSLRSIYKGWTFLDCYRTKSLVSQGQRGQEGKAAVAPEILIINGPEIDGARGLFA